LEIYDKYAKQLIDQGLAYYDFTTEEELEAVKAENEAQGVHTHYQGKWKDPEMHAEALKKIAAGEKPAIRFRAPMKDFTLQDMVKGQVVYPADMVGDFVIVRSNGLPVYNYCCVVDDMLMEITHVIRGEDHLSNTVRQLMLYEAFKQKPPVFAHVSLLIGQDRQKLSKRHGATSVHLYKEEHYLPQALCNYLTLLGWSHPAETDIFTKEEIVSLFNLERFSAHAAIYDLVKLKWVNGQHLRKLTNDQLAAEVERLAPAGHSFLAQTAEWKDKCMELLKQKVEFIADMIPLMDDLIFDENVEMTDELKEILSWETTPKIVSYIGGEVSKLTEGFANEAQLTAWSDAVKKDLGVKGKPLFMGLRAALTGKGHGPDLKFLIPLTPVTVLKKRAAKLGA
jgi:glutamyl-tRNA synthetase